MTTNYEGDIEAIMEMVLDDNTERAIGALWMLKERMRRDRIEARQPSTVQIAEAAREVLPPMISLRRRTSAAIDVPCPTCKAKVGRPCLLMSRGGGANSKVLEPPQAKEGYHSARSRKARES